VWKLLKDGKASSVPVATLLHQSAVVAARAPELYGVMGAPDTIEGRFELLTLHIILLMNQLTHIGDAGLELRQALFDTYVSNLDGAMREMGVADLSMGKRMRKLGEAFYGRAAAYEVALNTLPDLEALESLIRRTVLEGVSSSPRALADYVVQTWSALDAGPKAALLAGSPSWCLP
jgi:cytochrome b pre-mRNA-processing protein 3